MRTRSVIVALGLIALGLGSAPGAGAQTPLTCLPEVDGGQLDDRPPFAGRVRSAAGPDGTIASRSLRCPYVTEDGRVTELVLEWDERPLGRHRCRIEELEVEGAAPAEGRLDHPVRQASVVLTGPDVAAVEAMQEAARLNLAAVPSTAALCTAAAVVPEASSERGLGPVPVAVAGLVVVGLVLVVVGVRRRRSTDRAPTPRAADEPSSPAAVPAGIERIDASTASVAPRSGPGSGAPVLARHLVDQARRGRLDSLAAAAVLAHEDGRDDLASVAVQRRRSVRIRPGRGDGSAAVAGRILENRTPAADGAMSLSDARRVREQRLDGVDDGAGEERVR